jgi:hypothetical protein
MLKANAICSVEEVKNLEVNNLKRNGSDGVPTQMNPKRKRGKVPRD